jgi:hypothetical protein
MVPQKHTECSVRSETLTIPELEQSKAAVLNTLASVPSRRSYAFAIGRFIAGFDCSAISQNRQNRKFSVCRALGKRQGSRFYQESARAKNEKGKFFHELFEDGDLELR